MYIQITGRHINLGHALQQHCQEACDAFETQHAIKGSIHVRFSRQDTHQFTCALVLLMPYTPPQILSATGEDIYRAFDLSMHQLETKVRKQKKHADDTHKHRDNHQYVKFSKLGLKHAQDTASSHSKQPTQNFA